MYDIQAARGVQTILGLTKSAEVIHGAATNCMYTGSRAASGATMNAS